MTSEILPEFAHPDNAGQYFFTGPALRYRFVLFVEKEGFNPLLEVRP